ncbi:MAG TPA: hypothetical protein EYG03_07800, partial [Planctomycetes bacterium]|nr:hypothetical protein [Planctomycetota bacterium]
MLISSWLKSFRNHLQSRPRRITRRVKRASRQVELLEQKALLTSPLFSSVELPGAVALVENSTVAGTPSRLTLDFTLGPDVVNDVFDTTSVNNTSITLTGGGGDGLFGTVDDLVNIPLTNIQVNPSPNEDQISFQFEQQLLTGIYRLTLEGDTSSTPIVTIGGEAINNGSDVTFDFFVDLP